MTQFELAPAAQQWVNVVLIWLGFGLVSGLLAQALIPGRVPAGAMGTLLVGVVGSTLGPLVLCFALKSPILNPISPPGLLASVGGSVVLLLGYRLVSAFTMGAGDEPATAGDEEEDFEDDEDDEE